MADDFELAIKTSMSITGVEPLNPQWNQEEFNWIVIKIKTPCALWVFCQQRIAMINLKLV